MPSRRGVPEDFARYAGIGAQFAVTIGVFSYAGYWADGRLGSSPWLLLLGVFLGFGLGLTSMVAKLGHRSDTTATRPPGPGSDGGAG